MEISTFLILIGMYFIVYLIPNPARCLYLAYITKHFLTQHANFPTELEDQIRLSDYIR